LLPALALGEDPEDENDVFADLEEPDAAPAEAEDDAALAEDGGEIIDGTTTTTTYSRLRRAELPRMASYAPQPMKSTFLRSYPPNTNVTLAGQWLSRSTSH